LKNKWGSLGINSSKKGILHFTSIIQCINYAKNSGNARETFYDVTRCLHDKAQIESELKIARRNLALSGFKLIKKKNEPKNKPQNTQENQNEEKNAIAIVQQVLMSYYILSISFDDLTMITSYRQCYQRKRK